MQGSPLFNQEKVNPKVLIDDLPQRSKETENIPSPSPASTAELTGTWPPAGRRRDGHLREPLPLRRRGAMPARVSWDGGRTWEPELYKLTLGHGDSSAVVLKDGTIVTLAGDGQNSWVGRPHRPSLHPAGRPLETLAEGEEGWGVAGPPEPLPNLHPSLHPSRSWGIP